MGNMVDKNFNLSIVKVARKKLSINKIKKIRK